MKRKRLLTVIGSALITFAATTTVFAGTWKQDNVGWWWQRDNGSYPANGWEWIDGNNDGVSECYYFNASGYCLLNTTTPDGYKVDGNGAWIENGVVQKRVGSGTTAAGSSGNTTNIQPTKYNFTAEQILSFTGQFLHDIIPDRNYDDIWYYDYLKNIYDLGLAGKALYYNSFNKGWTSISDLYEEQFYYKGIDTTGKEYASLDSFIQYELSKKAKSLGNYLCAPNASEMEADLLRVEQHLNDYEWEPYNTITIVDYEQPFVTKEEFTSIVNRAKERMDGSNGIYFLQARYQENARRESVIGGEVYVDEPFVQCTIEYTNSKKCYDNRDVFRLITEDIEFIKH